MHTISIKPMNIALSGVKGTAIQFSCDNSYSSIRAGKSVLITYDGTHGSGHQEIQISSIIP